MKQKTIFIAALVLLAIVFAGGNQLYRSQKAQEAVAAAGKNKELLARFHSPSLGRERTPPFKSSSSLTRLVKPAPRSTRL